MPILACSLCHIFCLFYLCPCSTSTCPHPPPLVQPCFAVTNIFQALSSQSFPSWIIRGS